MRTTHTTRISKRLSGCSRPGRSRSLHKIMVKPIMRCMKGRVKTLISNMRKTCSQRLRSKSMLQKRKSKLLIRRKSLTSKTWSMESSSMRMKCQKTLLTTRKKGKNFWRKVFRDQWHLSSTSWGRVLHMPVMPSWFHIKETSMRSFITRGRSISIMMLCGVNRNTSGTMTTSTMDSTQRHGDF